MKNLSYFDQFSTNSSFCKVLTSKRSLVSLPLSLIDRCLTIGLSSGADRGTVCQCRYTLSRRCLPPLPLPLPPLPPLPLPLPRFLLQRHCPHRL